jgi:hypothetical protein
MVFNVIFNNVSVISFLYNVAQFYIPHKSFTHLYWRRYSRKTWDLEIRHIVIFSTRHKPSERSTVFFSYSHDVHKAFFIPHTLITPLRHSLRRANCVLDTTLCDKVCQWQVCGFLRFPPQIKLTATI